MVHIQLIEDQLCVTTALSLINPLLATVNNLNQPVSSYENTIMATISVLFTGLPFYKKFLHFYMCILKFS